MLVIVEGLDRCGKSTLVEHLRKRYFTSPNILVHHSSSPPKVDDPNQWELKHYDSLFRTSKDLVKFGGFNIIFDRFHLGAAVYGEKYRKANPVSVFEIDRQHLSSYSRAALILITDEPKAISYRDDGDSLESSIEDYEQTRDSFLSAFEKSSCVNKLHINITSNGGFKNTIPTVERFLNEHAKSS